MDVGRINRVGGGCRDGDIGGGIGVMLHDGLSNYVHISYTWSICIGGEVYFLALAHYSPIHILVADRQMLMMMADVVGSR